MTGWGKMKHLGSIFKQVFSYRWAYIHTSVPFLGGHLSEIKSAAHWKITRDFKQAKFDTRGLHYGVFSKTVTFI